MVCTTSLHGSPTWGILRTHQLRATALAPSPSSTTGSGPRYNNANFVQLSYSGIEERRSEWNRNFAWHFHNCRNPAFIALKPYEFKQILPLLSMSNWPWTTVALRGPARFSAGSAPRAAGTLRESNLSFHFTMNLSFEVNLLPQCTCG